MVDYPWDGWKDARGIFVWFKAAVECTTTSDETRGGNTMDQSLSQIPNPRMHNNLRRAYKTRVQLCNSLYQPSTTRHCQVLPVEPGTTRYWITWRGICTHCKFWSGKIEMLETTGKLQDVLGCSLACSWLASAAAGKWCTGAGWQVLLAGKRCTGAGKWLLASGGWFALTSPWPSSHLQMQQPQGRIQVTAITGDYRFKTSKLR